MFTEAIRENCCRSLLETVTLVVVVVAPRHCVIPVEFVVEIRLLSATEANVNGQTFFEKNKTKINKQSKHIYKSLLSILNDELSRIYRSKTRPTYYKDKHLLTVIRYFQKRFEASYIAIHGGLLIYLSAYRLRRVFSYTHI